MSIRNRLLRTIALICVGATLLAGTPGSASLAAADTGTDCGAPREYTESGLSITITVCGDATSLGTYKWRVTAWELITITDSRGFDEGLVGCDKGAVAGPVTTAPRMPSFASCLAAVNAGEVRRNIVSADVTSSAPQPDWRATFTVKFASNGGPVKMIAVRRDIPLP